MAYIIQDPRSGTWLVGFRFDGREFRRSCRSNREAVARRLQAIVEETLDLVGTGRLEVPDDVDAGLWIMSGGKVASSSSRNAKPLTFGLVCEVYKGDQKQKAESTQAEERHHIKHLTRILTHNASLRSINLERLKFYARKRSSERYRGRPICSTTIRKELATFRRVWVWAEQNGHVTGACPLIGPSGRWNLQLPKPREKAKFQTRSQIERRIARGGLSETEISELWKGLYLDEAQLADLLAHVEKHALHPFIYPMFAFATYTGARRSEIVRAQLDDVDFDTNQIMLRERKRRKHLSASTRFVPLHPKLRRIFEDWFQVHPGGRYLFVRAMKIKRGRPQSTARELTRHQATHHFKHSLHNSLHDVVGGFHVLRHSFGSNLVRTGEVPPHVVAQWMGHTTDEMRQLYQHLFPQDGVGQISVLR